MDTAFLRLQLPVAKQAVESFVAVELDGLDVVRVFEDGAQVLPQLVIFLLLIKLIEQDNKMLLVVTQTARFLPCLDNKIIVRLFVTAQHLQRVELDGHDFVLAFFLQQLHDHVGEEEERHNAQEACAEKAPVARL